MKLTEMVEKLNNGMTLEQLEEELRAIDLKKSEEDGKCFGVCETCGQKTVLVKEVRLCGPCCFGESDTANGEW